MSKKLQLSIPKPCHENWDAMTPVQQGKFCGSCQKQVVDFSDMSDRQVAEFFKKPSTGSVCGRFMTDQLERDIAIPKKRIPWFKYFFQFALPAFLVSIKASAQKTQGKIKITKVAADTTRKPVCDRPTMGIVARPIHPEPLVGDTIVLPSVKGEINPVITNEKRVVTGVVTDEKGDPLPGASVVIKGTRTGTFADNNGEFKILAKTADVLLANGAGLDPTEATIGAGNKVSITVKRIVLGGTWVGMISVSGPKKSKKKKEVPVLIQPVKDNTEELFKVFPNPVSSGTNLNIEWKHAEEGYYNLQLLNQSGQSVYQKEIWIDADARLLSIDVPSVSTGSYLLLLANKKSGKKFTEKVIIQ